MSSPPDDTDLDALPETENDSGTSGYIYDQLMFYYPLDPPLAMVPVQYSTHEPMGVPSEDYALASQWFHPQPIDRSQHTMQCPSAANVNNHAQAISPASPDTMDSVQNPEGLIPPSTKKQLLQEPPCSQTMSENFNNGQNPRVYPQKPQQEDASSLRCKKEGCSYSGTFKTKATLKRHDNEQHVNPNAYQCLRCGGRSFNRKEHLVDHTRKIHNTEA